MKVNRIIPVSIGLSLMSLPGLAKEKTTENGKPNVIILNVDRKSVV